MKNKHIFILPLLLTFLGYCGEGESKKSENWLSTSDLEQLVSPAGLTAQCQSAGYIKVQWNPDFDTIATHLQIERKTATTDFEHVADVAVDAGSFSDNVTNGVAFIYRVKAIIKDGDQVQYVSEDYSVETDAAQTSGMGCAIVVDPDGPSDTQSSETVMPN